MKLNLFPFDITIVVHMVSSQETADQNVSSDKVQQILNPQRDITLSQGIHDTNIHLSNPGESKIIPYVTKYEAKDSDATACTLQPDQEGRTHSLPLQKHLQIPDTLSHELPLLQSGQDSPSIIREKVSKDGYNWRKYGQKHVKGNEFIRSYYKCTYPNCQAKKQLQQSNNGHVTDSTCIGQHNHPKPQSNTILPVASVLPVVEQGPQEPSVTNVEAKSSIELGHVAEKIKPLRSIPTSVSRIDELKAAHSQLTEKDRVHNNEDREPKRLKTDKSNTDVTGVDMSTCETRVVVQTSSEVDFVNDGFRWRKYGQKLVKGNPNPRSYYRCSNPGCPVKKHVERASHDSKIVITTYEGQHDHEMPSGKYVIHNASTITHTMGINGKPETKSGCDTACVDTGERNCLESKSGLNEQQNGESITESKADDMAELRVIGLCNDGPESKLTKLEQQNEDLGAKDMITHSSSEVPCRSKENVTDEVDEVKTMSDGKKDCLTVVAGHDSSISDSKKQPTSDAEPVRS